MSRPSLLQAYLLCTLQEKARLSAHKREKQVGCIAAALFELEQAGCLMVEGKQVICTGPFPEGRTYLQPFYTVIREKSPVKLATLLEAYLLSLTGKRFQEFIQAVGQSLVESGLAQETKTGLLGKKTDYIPNPQAVCTLVERIRKELLPEGTPTEETAVLILLLEKTKQLSFYLSAFEQEAARQKITDLVHTADGKRTEQMVRQVESLLAAVFTAATSVSLSSSSR